MCMPQIVFRYASFTAQRKNVYLHARRSTTATLPTLLTLSILRCGCSRCDTVDVAEVWVWCDTVCHYTSHLCIHARAHCLVGRVDITFLAHQRLKELFLPFPLVLITLMLTLLWCAHLIR